MGRLTIAGGSMMAIGRPVICLVEEGFRVDVEATRESINNTARRESREMRLIE
jgi:hypothetical protein